MYKSFHVYFRAVDYCSSLLQPNADLSCEVPSLVSEAGEGWTGAGDAEGIEDEREKEWKRE